MLTSLFPNTHTRYTSLLVLGAFLEDLCSWLEAHGYPPNAISRRMEAAPFLEKCLQEQQISCCPAARRLCVHACRGKRWTPRSPRPRSIFTEYQQGRSCPNHRTHRNN